MASDHAGGQVGATYGTISPREEQDLSQYIDGQGWTRRHYLIVFYVCCVKAFCGCTVGSFPFIIGELQQEFKVGRGEVASAAGCLLVGSIVGAYIGGSASDAFGRRRLLLTASLLGTGLSLLHFGVTQLWHLCVVRLLLGVTFGSIVSSMNVFLIEFMPSNTRGWCICIAGLGWKAGAVYGVGLASVIQGQWRLVLTGGALPGLIAVAVFAFCAPESPRWLYLNGQDEQASNTLQWLFATDKLPRVHIGTKDDDNVADSFAVRVMRLFGPTFRLISFLCFIMWVMNVGAAYSAALWGPEMLKTILGITTPPYAFFMWMEILAGAAQLVYAYGLDWYGRRPVLSIGWTIIAGLLSLLLVVPPVYWMVFVLFLVINLPWDLMWAAKIAYTNEAFSTDLRGTAAGFLTGTSRAAGAFIPIYVGYLLDQSLASAVFALVIMLLVAAAASFLIPEETCQKQIKDVV